MANANTKGCYPNATILTSHLNLFTPYKYGCYLLHQDATKNADSLIDVDISKACSLTYNVSHGVTVIPTSLSSNVLHSCLNCLLTLRALENYQLTATFRSLGTETSASGECPDNRLDIYDGEKINTDNRLSNESGICGCNLPTNKAFKTTHNTMLIHFFTKCDNETQYGGFELIGSAVKNANFNRTDCYGQFECFDGRCIDKNLLCNGKANCPDASDEHNCTASNSTCAGMFKCLSDRKCINKNLVCNGEIDCPDRSDELNCTSHGRHCSGKFDCTDGQCINKNLVCDGKAECKDKSDEKDCNIKKGSMLVFVLIGLAGFMAVLLIVIIVMLCYRWSDIFCRPCLTHRNRFDALDQPDANDVSYKHESRTNKSRQNDKAHAVNRSRLSQERPGTTAQTRIYEETESVLLGVKRSLTDDFFKLWKQCQIKRCHDAAIKQLTATTTPSGWRETLDVDFSKECYRLLKGFRVAVGQSKSYKAIHELTDIYSVPAWQKPEYWTEDSSTLQCSNCAKELRGRTKFWDCRVCALTLCRKCSFQELLVYYEDNQPPGREAEPKPAIIKVVGSPKHEPRYSLLLSVCGLCRKEMSLRQTADPLWYSRLYRPQDPNLMDRLLETDRPFRRLTAQLQHDVNKLEEITATQRYPSTPSDEHGPDTGDADNSITSFKKQDIVALKKKVERSLNDYYTLNKDLNTAVSSLGKTAHEKERKLATNYVHARNAFYCTLISKASLYKLDVQQRCEIVIS